MGSSRCCTLQQGLYTRTSSLWRNIGNSRSTMIYLLLVALLLQQTLAGCPIEKTVGDTCYTRVAVMDTSQYGCYEGCTYKKTNDEESDKHYCFKKGSLPVSLSKCSTGNGTSEAEDYQDCSALLINSPGGTIKVEDSGSPTECNALCRGERYCIFWTMRQDIDKCWLFGFTTKFNVGNKTVYVSGKRGATCNGTSEAGGNQDCSTLLSNSPGEVIKVEYSHTPTECNGFCIRDPNCIFWTMRKDIKKCWLFGFTNEFMGNGEEVYVSGKRCDAQ